MEGYLEKNTAYFTNWSKRYFSLVDNILSYSMEKGGQVKGKIHLSISKIIEVVDNDKRFDIDTGLSTINIRCPSKKTRNKWVYMLKKAQYDNEKFERDFLQRNQAMFKEGELGTYGEIITLESKLDVIKKYAEIVENHSKEIHKLAEEKGSYDKIKERAVEIKTEFENQRQEVDKVVCYLERIKPSKIKYLNNFSLPETEPRDEFENKVSLEVSYNAHNYTNGKSVAKQEQEVEKIIEKKQETATAQASATESCSGSLSARLHTEDVEREEYSQHVERATIYDELYNAKRTRMPIERKSVEFSIWSLLKGSLGKNLGNFSTPVVLNEPISMLQRLAENFQYAGLLNSAAVEEDQYKRIALIATFSIAAFGFNTKRTLKSFNPILGETFEYVDNDLGFRFFSEQVSHHPPISASIVEGKNYEVYSNTHVETKFNIFKGNITVKPCDRNYILLNSTKERFTYTKPSIIAKNLIFGNLKLDCLGKCEVNNQTTGDLVELEYIEESNGIIGEVKGLVKNSNGMVALKIEGNWQTHVDIVSLDGERRENMWKREINEELDNEKHYYFTSFVANLNYLDDNLRKVLPKTDSRFRQDQKALEEQNIDLAEDEKKRLEEKQRTARKLRESQGKKWEPIYFQQTYDDSTKEIIYTKSRDYWEDRKKGDFSRSEDIFGIQLD